MLTKEDNDVLTRISSGTEMGALMRRFWIPALLEREVAECDGAPVRVRLLGEDLVAFRATDGKVGLIDAFCPHRRAPLFFGRNEECGLRCVYHGWKFDVSGACVDVPSESSDSKLKSRIKIKAYPTQTRGGVVWAYMGPPEHQPDLPDFEWARLPENQRYIVKRLQRNNWAQAVEGGLDSAHISFLHRQTDGQLKTGTKVEATSVTRFMRGTDAVTADRAPVYEIEDAPYGLLMGARRKSGPEDYYWRISHFLMPFYSMFPPGGAAEYAATAPYSGHAFVPIDDENTWTWSFGASPFREYTQEEHRLMASDDGFWGPVDGNFHPLLNLENDYLIDRNRQKRADFTGIKGIPNQDAAVQEGMGVISDRTQEHLVKSDRGVVLFRRAVLRAARELAAGIEPPAAKASSSYNVRSAATVRSRSIPFQQVMSNHTTEGVQNAALAPAII